MRQVGQDELIQKIAYAIGRWTPAMVRNLKHHDSTEQLRWRVLAAKLIVDQMDRYEILTAAPEGPPVHYAALAGTSGIPPQEPEDIPPATKGF